MVVHTCHRCNKQFNHKAPYDYHMYKMKKPCININKMQNTNTMQTNSLFKCCYCNKTYNRKDNLKRHMLNCNIKIKSDTHKEYRNNYIKSHPIDNNKVCRYCFKTFTRKYSLDRHINNFCIVKKEEDGTKEDGIKESYDSILKLLEEQNRKLDKVLENNRKLSRENKKLKNLINKPTNLKEDV